MMKVRESLIEHTNELLESFPVYRKIAPGKMCPAVGGKT
jgi:hypothetical protein